MLSHTPALTADLLGRHAIQVADARRQWQADSGPSPLGPDLADFMLAYGRAQGLEMAMIALGGIACEPVAQVDFGAALGLSALRPSIPRPPRKPGP